MASGLICLSAVLALPLWIIQSNHAEQIAALRESLLKGQWRDVMEIAAERLKAAAESGTDPQILIQTVSERTGSDAKPDASESDHLPHNRLKRAQISGQLSSWLVEPRNHPGTLHLATAIDRSDGSFTVLIVPAEFLLSTASRTLGLPWQIVDRSGQVVMGERDTFTRLPADVFSGPGRAARDIVRIDGESFHPLSIVLYDINDQPLGTLQALQPANRHTLQVEAWFVAMLMLLALVGAIFAAWLTRAIRRTSAPLSQLARAIRGLAAGDSFVTIPTGHQQAEVDAIASAVEVFRTHALKLDQLHFEADLARLKERTLLTAQLARLAEVLDDQARQLLEHDLLEDSKSFGSSDDSRNAESALPRALGHMTDRIIAQQTQLSALLAERTADLEVVRQALAERMQLNRLREEIAIARDLQLTYLPDTAVAAGLLPHVDLHAVMRPAKEVGGDVYDFRRLDERRLLLIIGDASGKGIPAAMYILMCRILLQTAASIVGSTATALKTANDALSRDNDALVFTTAFVAILDLHTGELSYTNAGHNKPLLRRADGRVETLSGAHGVLMGVTEGFNYDESSVIVEPGDTLLLYTDGVTEAHAPDDSLFGDARLLSSFAQCGTGTALECVQTIIDAVDAFSAGREQSDDITVTVLRRPTNS